MSIDNLKIDRSFILDVNDCEKNKSIVQNIVSMAHSLGLYVTAEGVEEESQLQFLRNSDCDYFQGYLFSKPLPKVDFGKVIGNLDNFDTNPIKHYIG
jgi:EAL domain-containing protein (putative c-di-GMP-specific phosphodiesterase class I)